jgi:type II secretory pathway component PulM
MGRFDLSEMYFERQFQLLAALDREKNSIMELNAPQKQIETTQAKPRIESALIQLGICKANLEMQKFFKIVADPDGLSSLLQWKSQRTFGERVATPTDVEV